MGSVAVVIGNHQGEQVLADCLASLTNQTLTPETVVVVDGASTDASEEIAASYGARWIAEENRGLGYLYNRGVQVVETDFVLLANNDIALDNRCLERLHAALAAGPNLFSADARQVDWGGDRRVHERVTLRRGPWFHRLLPGFELDMIQPAAEPVPTVTANGACMLVRRSAMISLGGFDETFFMDFEDLDLCWRAWLRGWGSIYVPDALVRHRVGAVTTAGVLPRRLASSHHNLTRFALKCLPGKDAAVVCIVELARIPIHRGIVARGLLDVLRELPEIRRLRRSLTPSRDLVEWMLAGQPQEAG